MEYKHAKPLHKKLKGSVCVQWVTCGKPSCKCTRGELHGPYYYRFWRENGRLRKEYVKREDLAVVQAATCAYHEEKQFTKDSWAFLRQSREALRDLRRNSPAINIQNAGQVNIAEKQVNLGNARDN